MIPYLEHDITSLCNLNCAGCSHFSPLAQTWFEDIEDFRLDFSKLSKMTDVGTIRIMGGEPLLHPDLLKFLELTREFFPRSEIMIVTNGILLKHWGDELRQVCNNNRIKVCVSNVNKGVDIQGSLRGYNLTRIDAKQNFYNISLNLEGVPNQQKAFELCDSHINKWLYFQGGSFYPCGIAGNIHHFNRKFQQSLPENGNSISIYTHTIEEIEEFLSHPIPLCKFCDTARRLRSYSPNHVSAGEISEWTCQ